MTITADDIDRMSVEEIHQLIAALTARQNDLELQNADLRSLLECHERLFEKSPIGCVSLDNNGIVQRINQAATSLLGYSSQAVYNSPLKAFIVDDLQNVFDGYLESLLNNQSAQPVNLILKNQDGDPISVECLGSSGLTPDSQEQICLVFNNISPFKESEKKLNETISLLEENIRRKTAHLTESNLALKRSVDELNHSRHQLLEREAKLNSILNASIEGIIVIDTSGIIVSVNAAVENIFGYSAEELIGYSVNLLMPITMRKKQDYYLEKYLRIFVPKVIGQIREVEGLRKDGSLVPLDMTIAEFPLDGMQYYSGIVRDVSARKLQEQQEKEHLEKLAHVTRLGLMGEMASGIAHEVNQPLSAVVNYTQVCLRFIQNENLDLEKISETLKKANQQALKAGQIIHSMREFVKPRKIHRSTVDINELIYDAISIFEADFKQHLITMRFELTKNLPCVIIDRVQIEQVILNLIRNSIDALKELPQFTQRQLSIETSLNPLYYIVVRVKDNGPGLSPIQREKILTPFFTTKASGMGMGLSISRSLVEAHHGTLHFNSKEDKGTTFYFTLPTEKALNGRNPT
ncbi:MAG: PAS domain S-box protein [Methylococcaceae bacterium]|nr:PAS domain S-box protein [Methylococcaceae bacterium]